jgi:hypothetical protein
LGESENKNSKIETNLIEFETEETDSAAISVSAKSRTETYAVITWEKSGSSSGSTGKSIGDNNQTKTIIRTRVQNVKTDSELFEIAFCDIIVTGTHEMKLKICLTHEKNGRVI